jgi:hypothetical protein
MTRTCSRGLVFLAALFGCGCALAAKKTPTPAARLDRAELARLDPPPGVRHYLLLFGSQDQTRRPAYTHTWATLVRVTETPGCPTPALDVHDISWLPVGLAINALSFRVEPGRNVDLHETIRNSLGTDQEIAMWGPYEVTYPFTVRFLTQKAFLDSGAIGYQCVDAVGEAAREGNGCDCIHAITDMDPNYPRWRYPLAFYGQPATANLVRRLMHSPIFIDPRTTHDWLIPALGLDGYPIERREYHGRVDPYRDGRSGDFDRARPVPLRSEAERAPEPAPKADTPAPKTDTPAPNADTPAPKATNGGETGAR